MVWAGNKAVGRGLVTMWEIEAGKVRGWGSGKVVESDTVDERNFKLAQQKYRSSS